MPKKTTKLLTTGELCARTGVSPKTVAKWRKNGLKAIRSPGGGWYRYLETEFARFLRSLEGDGNRKKAIIAFLQAAATWAAFT